VRNASTRTTPIPALSREHQDPLAIMLTREGELGKFLHLDFAALLKTTPSIYALLETLLSYSRGIRLELSVPQPWLFVST
jgi:hypothetical protein